jgi:hypothetical protein
MVRSRDVFESLIHSSIQVYYARCCRCSGCFIESAFALPLVSQEGCCVALLSLQFFNIWDMSSTTTQLGFSCWSKNHLSLVAEAEAERERFSRAIVARFNYSAAFKGDNIPPSHRHHTPSRPRGAQRANSRVLDGRARVRNRHQNHISIQLSSRTTTTILATPALDRRSQILTTPFERARRQLIRIAYPRTRASSLEHLPYLRYSGGRWLDFQRSGRSIPTLRNFGPPRLRAVQRN